MASLINIHDHSLGDFRTSVEILKKTHSTLNHKKKSNFIIIMKTGIL